MPDYMWRQPLEAQTDFLTVGTDDIHSHEKIYAAAFRKLYYHLYSNGSASRAERIISDLSNLLLCKIAVERHGGSENITRFLQGEGTANEFLLPVLHEFYPLSIDKDERFTSDDNVLRFGLRELTSFTFGQAPAHILGEAFQALIGPRLRGDKGQFFTPRSLVSAIVAVLNPPVGAKVVDPACGTGGFLLETHAFQANKANLTEYSNLGPLIGIDKDHDLCRLSRAILEIAAPHRVTVLNLNSLDMSGLSKLRADSSPLNADFVITNPPFGANIKVTDGSILKQFSLGHKWTQYADKWKQEAELRPAQDPQVLFLELCIRLLKPNGQMGIVLPEGIFGNSSLGYIWDYVRSQGCVTALIDCPRTTFQPSTDIKTNVLFFKKSTNQNSLGANGNDVWTAVALNCGHDRRGRTTKVTGERFPDDFKEIGRGFVSRRTGSSFWQKVNMDNPYYMVPRYYDKTPLRGLQQEATRLGAELVPLGDMVTKGYIHIRKGHEVGAEAYGSGDIPFVRTSDISNYEVSIDPSRSVAEEIYEQYVNQQQLVPGDILLVSDGRYRIGRTAILHPHNYKCVVQSHIRIISVTRKCPISAIEMLYLLNLPAVQHQVRNLVFIQSTLGALGKRLLEVCIPLPAQTDAWKTSVQEFKMLIDQRADLLRRLREFEHPGYEL